jgi:cobalt transporter subunit CbtA
MPVADLTARQVWWIGTAAATAIALWLWFFRSELWAAVLGLALIVLPHLIGAPVAPEFHSDVPAALSHRFVVMVTVTSLVFWVFLGVCSSITFGRMGAR